MAAKSKTKKPKKVIPDLAKAIDGVVPDTYKGTDRYLDVVCWNIRWFNPRDTVRVSNVARVLGTLNADVIVLEEIEPGSMTQVIDLLAAAGVGRYKVEYGTTGGDQRVTILYDTDWVRAKDTIRELVGRREVTTEPDGRGKDVFPRAPLWGYFTGLPVNKNNEAFDFQLVGLHLKSQRGDGTDTDKVQRRKAAEWLADWLEASAQQVDSDVLLLGDWNAPPSADAWAPFWELEQQQKVLFTKINDEDEISHLMYKRKDEIGSRLDLKVFSASAARQVHADPTIVRWTHLDEVLNQQPTAAEIKKILGAIRRDLSDHMPLVSRFYFTPQKARPID